MNYRVWEILAVILGIGFIHHFFYDRELTCSYMLKKICLPILVALILCIFISFVTHNIFIMQLPIWTLILYWAICGYIKIFKILRVLFIKKRK